MRYPRIKINKTHILSNVRNLLLILITVNILLYVIIGLVRSATEQKLCKQH